MELKQTLKYFFSFANTMRRVDAQYKDVGVSLAEFSSIIRLSIRPEGSEYIKLFAFPPVPHSVKEILIIGFTKQVTVTGN